MLTTASAQGGLAEASGPGLDAASPFEPGARVGRYEVMELLGEGGMGMVYRARDTELAREVALKRIDPGRLGLDESRVRLRREAQAMARIDHPSVVRIYDVGIEGGHLFVAMELVGGGTLTEWLQERPRGWRQIVSMFVAAGRGIAAAHRAGLVHRDIKPGNILVDACGAAKVTDFGLARIPDGGRGEAAPPEVELLSGSITRTGAVAGTPAYMAPEQIAGEPIDARADQFSFCVALWEALCGARPFHVDEEPTRVQRALLRAITDGSVSHPGAGVKVPRRILALVRRGLAGEATDRWGSMDELLEALERATAPHRGALLPGLGLAAFSLVAIVLMSSGGKPAGSLPRAPSVQDDGAETIAHTFEEQMTIILLRDGRYLRMERGELWVSAADSMPRPLDSPAGHRPVVARASGRAGWALVYTAGPSCTWWEVPVNGAPWKVLVEDHACARHLEVDVSPDGERLATAGEQGLRIRERASGAERVLLPHALIASVLSWSPDGRRLAVEIEKRLSIFDAVTGERRDLGGFGQDPLWFDPDRFFYVAPLSWSRSEIRMRDLRSGAVDAIFDIEGQLGDLSLGPDGLLALHQEAYPRLYAVETSTVNPRTVDGLTSLKTGAMLDFEPLAWREGALISSALIAGQRGLVRTVPGQRGVPIVQHPAKGIFHAGSSSGRILYGVGGQEQFQIYVLDLATGEERAWRKVGYDEIPQLECALQAPRCRLRGHPDRWFDPVTMQTGAPAPRIDLDEALSPDGTETVRVRGTTLVIRDLGNETETAIEPAPAIPGPIKVLWGADASTLLVLASRSEQNLREVGYHRLILMTRDGHWRAIIDDQIHTINRAVISEDGSQLAFTAQLTESTWRYLPFASRGQH